ncbi:hypothetical protein AOLI_G00217790 [Acnodon oligacanthus]
MVWDQDQRAANLQSTGLLGCRPIQSFRAILILSEFELRTVNREPKTDRVQTEKKVSEGQKKIRGSIRSVIGDTEDIVCVCVCVWPQRLRAFFGPGNIFHREDVKPERLGEKGKSKNCFSPFLVGLKGVIVAVWIER